jgi:ABC-type Fe3+ transport system permease subunit
MTLGADAAWSLGRATIVAICTVAIAAHLSRAMRGLNARKAFLAWTLLVLPWLTPALLQSFVFRHVASLARPHSVFADALYSSLLLLRHVPIATAMFGLLPQRLSGEALHCYRLLAGGGMIGRIWFRMRAEGGALLLVFCIALLLIFQEFELASLWNVRSWTIRLFDAHAGGLNGSETVRLAAVPLIMQGAMIACAVGARPRRTLPVREPSRAIVAWPAALYLLFSASVGSIFPIATLLAQSRGGWRSFVEHPALWGEIIHTSLFAAAAATIALLIGGSLVRRRIVAMICCVPGVLGGLILGLGMLALFQQPVLRLLRETPIPLLFALIFLLLPIAILLQLLLVPIRLSPELQIARRLDARGLLWELVARRTFAAFVLVFSAAYFEFTAGAILSPAGATPVFVRLHNLAHYGATPVLAAMMCAALTAPVVLCMLAPAVRIIRLLRD